MLFDRPFKGRHRRTKYVLLGLVGGCFLIWVAGLFAFLKLIPEGVDDATQKTDTIVVLTGGSLRGRRLAVPPGQGVRPTSDRARETLFNVLTNRFKRPGGQSVLSEARVLDAFAGTGALATALMTALLLRGRPAHATPATAVEPIEEQF